jgi:hypothetical protein
MSWLSKPKIVPTPSQGVKKGRKERKGGRKNIACKRQMKSQPERKYNPRKEKTSNLYWHYRRM